jgi:hypothetical protein
VIAAAILGSLVWQLRRKRIATGSETPPAKLPNIAIPFLFAGSYLVFLLAARSRQMIDLDSRMLSVVIPFIVIGLLGVYQRLAEKTNPRMAALPFVLPLVAFSINAFNTHTSIREGWRDLGEPGPVLGLTYHSTSGRQLDSLRGINDYFAPAAGDIVLTDIKRPLIVQYLFPAADVRRMPANPDADGLTALKESLERNGIAIISSAAWSAALSKELEGRAEFFRIESQSGGLEYIIMQLPVGAP